MQCPKCNATLTMGERKGIEIDYCTVCRGVWLDAGELDKIVERSQYQQNRGESTRNDHRDEPQRESLWERLIDIFD